MSTQTITQYLASREQQRRGLKEYAERRRIPSAVPPSAKAVEKSTQTKALRRMIAAGMPPGDAARRLAARQRKLARAH